MGRRLYSAAATKRNKVGWLAVGTSVNTCSPGWAYVARRRRARIIYLGPFSPSGPRPPAS